MITVPTVLVLGAGASLPYGFPLGATLRTHICRMTETSNYLYEALIKAGISNARIRDFASTFQSSALRSIDAFLEMRAEWLQEGKLALAAAILSAENSKRLYVELNKNPTSSEDALIPVHGDWYFELWNALRDQTSSPHQIFENQLRIATFNYDRSLECYLFNAIKATYGTDDAAAIEMVDRFPIRHLYGAVGKFHTDPKLGLPYLGNTDEQTLRAATASLKIIGDHRAEDDAVFREVRDWFAAAKRIYFLGFAFDSSNSQRLGLLDVLTTILRSTSIARGSASTLIKILKATAIGMASADKERAERLLCPPGIKIDFHPCDSLDGIRDWGLLT